MTLRAKYPERIECGRCGIVNHDIIASHKTVDDNGHDWYRNDYHIVVCCGCESIRFISVSQSSHDTDWEWQGQEQVQLIIPSVEIYPQLEKRRIPNWGMWLYLEDSTLNDLLREMYFAFNHEKPFSAATCIRAVVDRVLSVRLNDSVSPFDQRLIQFLQLGHIGEQDARRLKLIIEFGNAATHRGWKPEMNDISNVLDSVENLLERLYSKDWHDDLANRIPPKAAKKKKLPTT